MSDIYIEVEDNSIEIEMEGAALSPSPEAENDFLVASSAIRWVKKTLAQVKSILGLGSAAYTDTTAYATAVHTHTQSQVTSVAFQETAFANPLIFDALTYKDFTATVIWDTQIVLFNYSSGDVGMIQINIGGAGGHTITFDSAFNHKLGTTDLTSNVLGEIYYISWRAHSGTGIVYTIDKVVT